LTYKRHLGLVSVEMNNQYVKGESDLPKKTHKPDFDCITSTLDLKVIGKNITSHHMEKTDAGFKALCIREITLS